MPLNILLSFSNILLSFLSAAPGNFGAILSTKERPVGYYPVTMETLNLLLRLIHGISIAEDADDQPISFLDLAACLVFVMREVFTGFHKWRFTGLKDREEIGNDYSVISLMAFHQAS